MENKTKKEEGFADFIDGIEDVVTLTPSASSPFSETLSQSEPEVEPKLEKKINSENMTSRKKKSIKEEGFADFIDGIEDVVTLAPSASNSFSETLSQSESEVEPDGGERQEGFNVKKLFFVCLSLFGVSSLGAFLSPIVSIFAATVYLWYIAAGLSLVSVIVLFLIGIVKGVAEGSFKFVGYAIMFLVVLGVVGFGTCILNMGAM